MQPYKDMHRPWYPDYDVTGKMEGIKGYTGKRRVKIKDVILEVRFYTTKAMKAGQNETRKS